MTKRILIATVFAVIVLLFSCNDRILFVNCSECVTDEPLKADIKLKIEPETGNWVDIKVYRGVIEDSIIVDSFTTDSPDYTYSGELNTRYTFTAEYLFSVSGKRIIAVNSAWPRVRYEKKQCQNPCYYIYDNVVNLRIKYQ